MQPSNPSDDWWRIDPTTGNRVHPDVTADDGRIYYLGDRALNAAGTVALNINATFGASKHFSDEEVRRLLEYRVVPASVRPYDDASAELLESIDDLWTWVDQCYQEAWGRPANDIERRFIAAYAFSILRPKNDSGPDVTN